MFNLNNIKNLFKTLWNKYLLLKKKYLKHLNDINFFTDTKKFILSNLLYFVCLISFLLLFLSPVFSILWLCITTLYFLYTRNYKNIGQSWLLLLIVWYLLFTFSISIADLGITSSIVIGPGHTNLLLCLLLKKKYIFFESLVFQTVYILDEISLTLGCSIYIPVLPIFSALSK